MAFHAKNTLLRDLLNYNYLVISYLKILLDDICINNDRL